MLLLLLLHSISFMDEFEFLWYIAKAAVAVGHVFIIQAKNNNNKKKICVFDFGFPFLCVFRNLCEFRMLCIWLWPSEWILLMLVILMHMLSHFVAHFHRCFLLVHKTLLYTVQVLVMFVFRSFGWLVGWSVVVRRKWSEKYIARHQAFSPFNLQILKDIHPNPNE